MKKEELGMIETKILMDIICDICGESCIDSITMNYEYLNLFTRWGYGSKHDGEPWAAQVCEKCTLEILEPLIKFNKEAYYE